MLHISPRIVEATTTLTTAPTAASLTGRSLAAKLPHLSKVERAFLGADLHNGKLKAVSLTLGQAALLARVNVTYIKAAVVASCGERGERFEILAGIRQLIKAKADDATLIQLAKTVGADRWIAAGIAAGL
jgi:hypothetical protein